MPEFGFYGLTARPARTALPYSGSLDAPPAVASPWDDEFDGTALNPKWLNPMVTAATFTATVAGGCLSLKSTVANKRGYGISQVSPPGSFTVSAFIGDSCSPTVIPGSWDTRCGIFVAVNGGKGHVWGPTRTSGAGSHQFEYIGVTTYNEGGTDWSSYDGSNSNFDGAAAYVGPLWYRFVWNAGTSTLTYTYSRDGVNWTFAGSRASLTQPNRCGLVMYNNSATQQSDHAMSARWFRVTTP